MKNKYYLSVIIGATLWGIISIFVKDLYLMGLNTTQIVALRAISATIILISYTYIKDKKLLKIRVKDIYYFIGTGLLSIVFFSWCYFFTMEEESVSIAVILLYTAPAIVTIISRFAFKEMFTTSKFISLILTFIGLLLVTGYLNGPQNNISALGLLTGLGSGLGYALYSIIGKYALRKYHVLTVTTYTFIVASIFLLPVLFTIKYGALTNITYFWFQVMNLGLFPTALAYIFYTTGLVNLESSRASITATIEPLVGTLIGLIVFHEVILFMQWIGILMILSSIFVVQMEKKIQ
ncbi:MAG: EamA family transporter [Clostridiales bacterium]|nr:EamA family transporter [Clostridiales bacterium]